MEGFALSEKSLMFMQPSDRIPECDKQKNRNYSCYVCQHWL